MKQPSSTNKFLGLFLIVGSLSLLYLWIIYDFAPSLELKKKNRITKVKKISKVKQKSPLQKLWEEDIVKMHKAKLFDKGISSIRKVRVFLLDQNLHSQMKGLKTPFRYKKSGQNLLEVSFMSHHSELDDQEKLVVQYNLTDKDSGNMFWEHSRTITIPKEMVTN